MNTHVDTKEFKESVHRIHEHLQSKGVTVAFADVLESVSVGLGIRNWRTLKEKLHQETSSKAAISFGSNQEHSSGGQKNTWMVHGVWENEGQPFSDYIEGKTLEQAFLNAQVCFRNSYSLYLHSMQDLRLPRAPTYSITHLRKSEPFGIVLESLLKEANKLIPTSEPRGIAEAEALDQLNLQIEILTEFVKHKELFTMMTADLEGEKDDALAVTFPFIDSRGVTWEDLKGFEIVEALYQTVVKTSQADTWEYKDNCEALIKYASEDLNFVMANYFFAMYLSEKE